MSRGARFARRLGPVLVAGLFACLGADAGDDPPQAVGKRIYRDGRLASGLPLVAAHAGGVRVEGRDAACATCHRKSGLGGAEGRNVIRPLTVPGFFAGQENQRRQARRPSVQLRDLHYTDEAFDRALREGRSPDGRVLDPLMPRYALDAADVAALRAYLSSVALQPSPGVTDREIHFATIIAPDADPQVRAATLEVLGAMVDARNAGTRSESHRWRAGVDRMHVDWRKWVLHVWELSGDAGSWAAQLERLYREQAVFAVLSGAGQRWQPMHDFCERHELPCLFPNVDLPGRPEPGDYTLYLSRGVLVEADVMAQHLSALGWSGPVWQIHRGDHRAEAGSRAFRLAWQARGKGPVKDIELRDADTIEGAVAAQRSQGPAALVLWLDGAELDRLARIDLPGPVAALASGTLMGRDFAARAPGLADRLLVVWPFALPDAGAQRFDRAREWLAARGIAAGDRRTQANTYYVAAMASETVMHLGSNYSRDYFIERIEHNADKSLASGAFPQLGLGPGQRFASKGAYVARLAGSTLAAQGGWIVP